MGISNRGTKAKSITSCDNAFVTYIGAAAASLALRFRAKNICWPETLQRSGCFLCESATTAKGFVCAKAKRQRQCFICAKAKRQQQMFCLRESEASATMFYLCESEATATNVLSARKRSGSDKAPSRNGNQSHAMLIRFFRKS
ncbi:hypothetical protein ACQKNB_10265 [Lysinibacillus xylanilyticus]|uniref:hypothetical protein n=1 Tax=Lysinibacillus xylanilyticus TaxID=582475 RepID=UPI003CFD09C9